jgi:hypothetical protein
MSMQKGNTNDERYWDNYSESYNVLAGKLLEHNIDIRLLKKMIRSYDKYKKQLMKEKIKALLSST